MNLIATPERILFSREIISARVREMGALITADYRGKTPCLVAILKGASIFHADLMRAIALDATCDFMAATSYGDATQSSGQVRLRQELAESPAGKDVILVEDIIDTGLTLRFLRQHILERGPASLKIAAFIDKPSRRRVNIAVDYVGFTVADEFIVGYGMDYAGRFRNLPDIRLLRA